MIDTIYMSLNLDPETREKVWFADAHIWPNGHWVGMALSRWEAIGHLVEFLEKNKVPLANSVLVVDHNPILNVGFDP